MKRLNLLWAALKRAFGVAAAIVELDDIVQRCRLTTTEVRRSLGHLAESFRPPQTGGDLLATEIAVALCAGIVTEVAIYAKVAAGGGGVADKRLVRGTSGFGGVSMRRKFGIDLKADHVEVIV